MKLKFKILGLVLAVCLVAGLAAFASHATGAYFSDTHSGTVTGAYGAIKISPSGDGTATDGNSLDMIFSNLMPGVPATVTVNYTNTGVNPEDVYIVFPNADALKALNDYGTYASVAIVDNAGGVNWVSNNLNDYVPEGSTGSPNPNTYYVPEQMLLQSNLASGYSGTMTFTFTLAGKASDAWENQPWNASPIATETKDGETYTTPAGETVGEYNGLPYEIVATQVGQTPGPIVLPPLTPAPIAPW